MVDEPNGSPDWKHCARGYHKFTQSGIGDALLHLQGTRIYRHFRKLKNIVNFLTLIFVGIYTVVSCEQLSNGKDSEARQIRAFVNVGEIEAQRVRAAPGMQPYWKFTPIISNDGETPTENLRISVVAVAPEESEENFVATDNISRVALEVWGHPQPYDTWWDPDTSFNGGKIGIVIGPHARQSVGSIEIQESTLQKYISLGYRPYIFGELKYKDILPKTLLHTTKFCYFITGEIIGTDDYLPVRNFCPHWNCADDECGKDKEQADREALIVAERMRPAVEPCRGPRVDCADFPIATPSNMKTDIPSETLKTGK